MAITALTLGGYDVFGGTIVGSTAVDFGGSYSNLSEDVLTSDSTNEVVNITGDTVDTSIAGDYTVIYTATDDAGDGDLVFTETVTVAAEVSTYDALVAAANAGTPPPETSSAYFSELELDPYEVKHSN